MNGRLSVLRTSTIYSFAGSMFFIALSGLPALGQETQLNHLDCWYEEASKTMQCPPVSGLQTGRASRVDRVFDSFDAPAENTQPAATPPPVPRPERRVKPTQRTADVAEEGPKTPSCHKYRTYDAATNTYRGYDGVVRKCR